MKAPLLELQAVGLEVAGTRLLQDINFAIGEGEILAVLGANGAGKSSLIELVSAAFHPSDGQITFDGMPLAQWSLQALAERRALNAGEPQMPFAMRVDECVALGRPFAAINAAAVTRCLDEAYATQWAARDYATLSSGEQMRVQIARSLYQLGDSARCLWLLDEPGAHLDLAQRQFVLALIARIARTRQWGVVFSTHDPAEAAQIADQALLLRQGRTIAYGATREVLTEILLSECYGVPVVRRNGFAAAG